MVTPRRLVAARRRAHRRHGTSGSLWLLITAAVVVAAGCSAIGVASASPTTSHRQPVPTTIAPTGRTALTARAATARVVAQPAAPTIGVAHGHLTLAGAPYRFVGLNAYELATFWGRNAGCGAMLGNAQLDGFFAAMPQHSLVRIWAWEGSMAINFRTKQLDWGPLDRVFNAASKHHDFLLVSLAGQDGTCDDGHWKNAGWFLGGYRRAYNDDGRGLAPVPYWDYVRKVVQRYSSSPAVGMWEPLNEPEASSCAPQFSGSKCYGHLVCPSERLAAVALRTFFDSVGGEIHRLDPRHLVESGFIGSGQCGTSGGDYRSVNASPGVDVLSYHDYYAPTAGVGGDQWNGISVRLGQAAALGKPIIGGELGVSAGRGSGCASLAQRVANIRAKASRQMSAGSDGVLLWDWQPAPTSSCDYSTYPGDPVLALIRP
jgi:mannan endo-1,4-beta-mannosidase